MTFKELEVEGYYSSMQTHFKTKVVGKSKFNTICLLLEHPYDKIKTELVGSLISESDIDEFHIDIKYLHQYAFRTSLFKITRIICLDCTR